MSLTVKGQNAIEAIIKYCPKDAFCAKEISDKSGEKIAAATLNSIANNGYITRLGGSPVRYQAIEDLVEIFDKINQENKENSVNNGNLRAAKKQKNDEFYTRYEDIEAELMRYRKQFRDKIIYLPCDDPANKKSEFWSFFVLNFDAFGLKKLIATHYDENGKAYKIWIDDDTTGDGFIDDGDAQQEELEGNGDFRSPECIEILKECDIVCTNPPFSLFREFISWLMEYKKKFIVWGNNNAITYKEIFPLLKDNKMWLGYIANKTLTFGIPDNYLKWDAAETARINDGNHYAKVPAISIFTNLDVTKRHEKMILTKKYDSKVYLKYDNYDAINVDRVVDIPSDYEGVMGVPITFLDKYNPEQFEIVGLDRYVPDNPKYGHRFTINGKETYARILIRRKNKRDSD